MRYLEIAGLMVLGAIAAAGAPSFAQPAATPQQPAAASAEVTAASASESSDADDVAAQIAKANAAAAANAKAAEGSAPTRQPKFEPSADARKKASQYGFHPEVYDGKTLFCKDDATLGTRLSSKKCMDAVQFEEYAVQLQYARDALKANKGCNGQGLCGGLQ